MARRPLPPPYRASDRHGYYTRGARAHRNAQPFAVVRVGGHTCVPPFVPEPLKTQAIAAIDALHVRDVDAFVASAGFDAMTPGWWPRVRVQYAPLRTLLHIPQRQRGAVARRCHALLGASLSPRERSASLLSLSLATQFGSERLAHLVRLCVPSCVVDAVPLRAQLLACFWHDVGPARLPWIKALCQPILTQRRLQPHLQAQAILAVFEDRDALKRTKGLQAAPYAAAPVRRRHGICNGFEGDTAENVMQPGRMQATCEAIRLIRAEVAHPLAKEAVFRCIQFFIVGRVEQADGALLEVLSRAWTTITGEKAPFGATCTRVGPSAWRPEQPSSGTRDAAIAETPCRLTGAIALSDNGLDHATTGEVLSWVWQAIHRYTKPELGRAENQKTQDNLRYSLLRALAECQGEWGPVCDAGIAQRLVTVLQRYLPFVIDSVDQDAAPQAVVTYLLQCFANQVAPYTQPWHAGYVKLEPGQKSEMMQRKLSELWRDAQWCAEHVFEGRPGAKKMFEDDLAVAIHYDYDEYLPEAHA